MRLQSSNKLWILVARSPGKIRNNALGPTASPLNTMGTGKVDWIMHDNSQLVLARG